MNYFSLLSLPQTFELEPATLEAAYFFAQRQYHPDRFISKTPEERVKAAAMSADVNEAYNTLKQPLSRAKHLLSLSGIGALDEADNDTLMEMMELREQLEAGKKPNIAAMIATCEAALSAAFSKGNLSAAKSLTIRLIYLYKMHTQSS